MSHVGRKIVDYSKVGRKKYKKGRVIDSDRKGGNYQHIISRRWEYYFYKRPPDIPTRGVHAASLATR